MRRLIVTAMSGAIALLSSCNSSSRAKVDACALLTAEDIQSVQNAPLKDKVGNHNITAGVYISQCYFAADPPHQSVSLATTQSDPDGKEPGAVKEYWKKIAGAQEREDDEAAREKRESLKEHAREEENESASVKKINGVGDDAYWAGSRVGGALYVLKKDVIVRVSVGGPDPEPRKIDKSKAIAAKAISRL